MIPVLILVLAVGALVQFFMAYCLTLLLTYSKVGISQQAPELAGIPGEIRDADESLRPARTQAPRHRPPVAAVFLGLGARKTVRLVRQRSPTASSSTAQFSTRSTR